MNLGSNLHPTLSITSRLLQGSRSPWFGREMPHEHRSLRSPTPMFSGLSLRAPMVGGHVSERWFHERPSQRRKTSTPWTGAEVDRRQTTQKRRARLRRESRMTENGATPTSRPTRVLRQQHTARARAPRPVRTEGMHSSRRDPSKSQGGFGSC